MSGRDTFADGGIGMNRIKSMMKLLKRLHVHLIAICVITGCGGQASLPDDNGKAIAETFLTNVRSGKVEEAWNETSTEFKSLMGRDTFRLYVKRQPVFKSEPVFDSAKPVENENMQMVECVFTVNKPKQAHIKVVLVPSDDSWLVERLSVE